MEADSAGEPGRWAGVPEGWVVRPSKAFGTHVGPFYIPLGGGTAQCGFVADARHGNKRGVVHGGMLATAFDTALGNAAWEAGGGRPSSRPRWFGRRAAWCSCAG